MAGVSEAKGEARGEAASAPPPRAPRRNPTDLLRDRWLLATVAVIAITVGNHVAWVLADGRMPQDLGLYYTDARAIFAGLRTGEIPWERVFSVGGWYNLLFAVVLQQTGRSAEAFRAFDVVWTGLTLVAGAGIAQRLTGRAGAFVATALMASMPVVVIQGRIMWIHTPETALVLIMTWAWLADRRLERVTTLVLHAVAGGLVIWLRPSGLIWVVSLLPFLAWGEGRPRPWRRMIGPVVVWGLCAVPALLDMDNYLMAKAGARERYTLQVPDVMHQLQGVLGMFTSYVCVLLAPFGLRRPFLPRLVLLGWAAGAVLLWAIFRAGIDNFPLVGPGFALLAGGFALLLPRVATVIAGGTFALFVGNAWMPAQERPPQTSMQRMFMAGTRPDPGNYSRAWSGYGAAELKALLAAVCPVEGTCTVIADQGLLHPYSEEAGQLEFFLSRRKNAELHDLRNGMPQVATVHALVHFECGDRDMQFRQRFPQSSTAMRVLVNGFNLGPAWSTQYGTMCTVWWYTPSGRVANPTLLPVSSLPASSSR